MAPDDSPAAVGPEPGGRSARSVAMTPELWKDNLRQLYEGETLRSVRFRYALLALDIATVLFIVASSCPAPGSSKRSTLCSAMDTCGFLGAAADQPTTAAGIHPCLNLDRHRGDHFIPRAFFGRSRRVSSPTSNVDA